MFNPNEEIQIISYSLKEAATLQDKLLIEDELTQLNKKLELKNRYNELLIENSLLKRRISQLEENRDKVIEFIKTKFVAQGGFTSYEWNDLLQDLLDILKGEENENSKRNV